MAYVKTRRHDKELVMTTNTTGEACPPSTTIVPEPQEDRLLTEREVAIRQHRSIKTLQNQRVSGGGIPYLKRSRSVRYRLSDVIAWENSHLRTSTSEKGR